MHKLWRARQTSKISAWISKLSLLSQSINGLNYFKYELIPDDNHTLTKLSVRMGKRRRESSMAGSLQREDEQYIKTPSLKEGISNSNPTLTNPTAMQLEKMGGELKCPICLSLLNQAALLTCNHIFCKTCILRSIKSASVCPVCKVPCSRTEVRPDPHMDNLVNIYKSMQAAAGISIFVSQPSIAKDSTDDQGKENMTPCRNDLEQKTPAQTEARRKKIKTGGPKDSRLLVVSSHKVQENANSESMEHKSPDHVISSPHQPVKHLFPTKKRVQLSLYPPGSVDGSNLERKQALDGVENDSLTCANVEIGGELKKQSCKKKVKLINSDKQACLERKTNGNIGFESRRETNNVDTIGKKRQRRPTRSNGRNVIKETVSHLSDPVACSSAQRFPNDSNKELNFTTDEIFDVMFGLSANEFATDISAAAKPQSCSDFQKQEHQNQPDSYCNASKQDKPHPTLSLTQECSNGNERVDCGSNLGPTSEADPFKMQPQALGSGCVSDAIIVKSEIICVFCQTSGNSEAVGEMLHYINGRPLPENKQMPSNVVHVHKLCAAWAPDAYFKGDRIMNLEEEVARGVKIKCSMCGIKGAALGCCITKCHRSFHVPCALSSPDCRWDTDNFIMLCPTHSRWKFPKESKPPKSSKRDKTPPLREQRSINETPHRGGASTPAIEQALAGPDLSQSWKRPLGLSSEWVLCGSALDAAQEEQLNNFANLVGAAILGNWRPTVTHVVASTDASGACIRSKKLLMAILEGKWVLRLDWIAACIKAGHPVNEELFQVTHDNHGAHEGPKRGRERVEKKAPRLFEGLSFYLSGEFNSSLKGHLQDLILLGGGLVLYRKPIMGQPDCSHIIVLYSIEIPQTRKHDAINKLRHNEAKSLAHTVGAQVADHQWVLKSIADYQLQPM